MKRIAILILLISALLLAACGGGSDETPADSSAPPPAAASATDTPVAEAPAAAPTNTPAPPTATPEPAPATDTPAADTADEPVTSLADLSGLKSYRARTVFQSEGTRTDGTPVKDVVTMETAYSSENDARYMTMNVESADADPENPFQGFEFYQIGGDMYMFGGPDTGWVRIASDQSPFQDPSTEFLLDSSTVFSNLDSLKRQRPDEKIAGVDSRHYTFDEKALATFLDPSAGTVSAKGDVWIAKDGDYVTKYIFDATVNGGGAGQLDPTLKDGTMHLEFELLETNTDITVELPEEALTGTSLVGFEGESLPLPDGATITASTSQFAIVQTDLPVEEAQQFYDDALQGLGWTKDESSSMSFGDMVSLAYTKDNAKLTVLIQADQSTGTTQVMINAEESQ
ncbi:MAG: hypothetical protein R2844_11905 [Caldilineales bacterium]